MAGFSDRHEGRIHAGAQALLQCYAEDRTGSTGSTATAGSCPAEGPGSGHGAQPAADRGSLAESQEWENMMRNAMEDLEPASPMTGVLERALQQAPPLSTGQSAARTPRPVVAVSDQESAFAAPLGGRKSPHAPKAKVAVKEATKSAPSHQPPEASLRAKLQAKRAALQPFGVEPATAPPVA